MLHEFTTLVLIILPFSGSKRLVIVLAPHPTADREILSIRGSHLLRNPDASGFFLQDVEQIIEAQVLTAMAQSGFCINVLNRYWACSHRDREKFPRGSSVHAALTHVRRILLDETVTRIGCPPIFFIASGQADYAPHSVRVVSTYTT